MPVTLPRNPDPAIGRRIGAALVDQGLLFAVAFAFIYTVGEPNEEGGYTATGCLPCGTILVVWLLYFVVADGTVGATLGKYLFDVRVIRVDGRPLEWVDALKRHICDPIDFSVAWLPALILVIVTPTHQRVGDFVAGTQVVRSEEVAPPPT